MVALFEHQLTSCDVCLDGSYVIIVRKRVDVCQVFELVTLVCEDYSQLQ